MCESDEGNKHLNNEFILTEVLKLFKLLKLYVELTNNLPGNLNNMLTEKIAFKNNLIGSDLQYITFPCAWNNTM